MFEDSVNDFEVGADSQVDAEIVDDADVQGDGAEPATETAENESVGDLGGDQDTIGQAFSRERQRIMRQADAKLRQDPVFALGDMLVNELMESGMTREQAVAKAKENIIAAQARKRGVDPYVASQLNEMREFIGSHRPPTYETERERILGELDELDMPGFDMKEALNDPSFKQDLIGDRMPLRTAARLYMATKQAAQAPQQIADQLKARQALPQSGIPQKSATPERDYSKMSDEEFDKLDRDVHRQLGAGYYDL